MAFFFFSVCFSADLGYNVGTRERSRRKKENMEDEYLDAAYEDRVSGHDYEQEGYDDEPFMYEYEPDCDDGDDGDALASAGWGVDEDY